MITKQPDFYDKFHCIADKCEVNCCKKWNISIDNNTYDKYMKVEGELGEKLKKYVIGENNSHKIKLLSNNVCPFQDEKGLCEIVKEKGPEYLSETCTNFPRLMLGYADIIEKSLSAGCPAVIDFFFEEKHINFIENDDGIQVQRKFDNIDERAFIDSNIRDIFISILKLENFPLWTKQYFVLDFANKIKEYHLNNNFDEILKISQNYTDIAYLSRYSEDLKSLNFDSTFKYINIYDKFNEMLSSYFALFGDELGNNIDLTVNLQELLANEERFEKEVYSDIEHVIENLCVTNIFSNGIQYFRKYYLYENLVVIFISAIVTKFALMLYWYSNNFEISKEKQKIIISTVARRFAHSKSNMLEFYEKNEKILMPVYLLMLLK